MGLQRLTGHVQLVPQRRELGIIEGVPVPRRMPAAVRRTGKSVSSPRSASRPSGTLARGEESLKIALANAHRTPDPDARDLAPRDHLPPKRNAGFGLDCH